MIFPKKYRPAVTIVLILLSLVFIFQFYWMAVTSLQRQNELFQWPPQVIPKRVSLTNYQNLQWPLLGRWLLNSTLIASSATLLNCLLAGLGGYALAKLGLRAGKTILALLLLAAAIPKQITLVPKFILVARGMNLYDNLLGVILPSAFLPICIYLARQYCLNLSNEVLDAARVDGANEGQIVRYIILPLLRPILATIAILTFTATWGDFLWQLVILQSVEKFTAPLGLVMISMADIQTRAYEAQISAGIQCAAGLVLGIPACLLFLWLQRYFIRNMRYA